MEEKKAIIDEENEKIELTKQVYKEVCELRDELHKDFS